MIPRTEAVVSTHSIKKERVRQCPATTVPGSLHIPIVSFETQNRPGKSNTCECPETQIFIQVMSISFLSLEIPTAGFPKH